jgi:acetyl-CoA decarbonylase/synthase complex subunit delta
LAFQPPVENYKGRILQVALGDLSMGGEAAFPYHAFDGAMPNRPLLAFEVWDEAPTDWSPALNDVYADVYGDPVAWARRVVKDYGADLLYLRLKSADPDGSAKSPAEAAAGARTIVESAGVPAIVVTPGEPDHVAEVLKAAAEALAGLPVIIGNAIEANYRSVGAAALGYGQSVVAFSPMDVNLAKQLNVLLTRLGLDDAKLLMDPTTGALGYGLDYSYTVFERGRLAALAQNDAKMQLPMLALPGQEAWKTKEGRTPEAELPGTGDLKTRGVMWESMTAVALMLAGANILALRHPESAVLVRKTMDALGGA